MVAAGGLEITRQELWETSFSAILMQMRGRLRALVSSDYYYWPVASRSLQAFTSYWPQRLTLVVVPPYNLVYIRSSPSLHRVCNTLATRYPLVNSIVV